MEPEESLTGTIDSEESLAHVSEVARGTFWGLLGNGIFKIITFAYTIYIARVVAQSDVGLFYLALSLVGLFGAWKTFGLPASLARYIPYYESRGEHGKVRSLLWLTYAINVVSGVLFAAAVWLLAGYAGTVFQNPGLPEALRLISSYLLLDNIFSINSCFLQGKADMKSMQLASNVQNTAKLVFTIILFWLFGATLSALIAAFTLSYLLATALSAKMVWDSVRSLPSGEGILPTSELLHEIIPFGIMLSIVQILWTLVSYADRVVLGYMLPHQQANDILAIYSIAVAFAINVMVFPSTVGNIFLPAISRLVGKNDMDGVRKAIATSQRWMLFISVPFTLVMIAFSNEMLSAFFGAAYAPGAMAMSIFSAGLLFSAFAYAMTLALAGMRRVDLEFRVALTVMVVNVILCIILIPPYGIEGAAFAAAVGFALSALMFSHYSRNVIGFHSPASIYRMFAAAVISCVILFLLKPYVASAALMLPQIGGAALQSYVAKGEYLLLLGLVAAIAFIIFTSLSLFLKCFGKEDIAVMKKASRLVHIPLQLEILAEKIALLGVEGKT